MATIISAQELSVMLRIVFALILGIVIGSEREKMGKSAGMRTHSLVCMSSAAIVSVSMLAFPVADSGARAIAAVITGIGFLGAGQIMVSGGRVSGLTTAASIWASAIVGCIAGLGYYLLSAVITILTYAIFQLKRYSEH
jgi:putative Mg2+ transporter-C (MgtC) family protein